MQYVVSPMLSVNPFCDCLQNTVRLVVHLSVGTTLLAALENTYHSFHDPPVLFYFGLLDEKAVGTRDAFEDLGEGRWWKHL